MIKTTVLYNRSPKIFSIQRRSMYYRSRKDNTLIRSGFLVIRQLSCIIEGWFFSAELENVKYKANLEFFRMYVYIR